MPITRDQLVTALSNWCIQFCYEGCPQNQRQQALMKFCNSQLVPQENDIPATAANYFQQHHYSAYFALKGRLEAIGFHTNLSPENKALNLQECTGWATQRKHHVEEVHALLTDLANWQVNYRGSKAVLNTLKIIRALSR